MFPNATDTQKQMLERISALKIAEEFQEYLSSLVPYLVEFPQVTEKQIKKLFPKNKKLKVPDLLTIDCKTIFNTYPSGSGSNKDTYISKIS